MAHSSRENGNGSGDPLLREVLAWGEQMTPRLARAYPGLGRDEAAAAWSQVVFRWWEKHGHSGESPRPRDLYRNACGRLRDVAKSEAARRDREGRWVADLPKEGDALTVPTGRLVAKGEAVEAAFRETCQGIEALLPEDERVIFPLWLGGERKTEVYAEALGIPSETPIAEQRKTVRKVKDRLRKRLGRNAAIKACPTRLAEACAARNGRSDDLGLSNLGVDSDQGVKRQSQTLIGGRSRMRYAQGVFRAAMLALIVAFGSTALVSAAEECPTCECEERSFGAVAKETFCGGAVMYTFFQGENAMDECEDYCHEAL